MLNSIQALRVLAAWLVVLHHCMQIFFNFEVSGIIAGALSRYGAIGVDLFFVISGFVIYNAVESKKVSPGMFALHRLARIVPAYWVFTLLTAVTLVYLPGVVPFTEYAPVFLLKSLLFIPGQNPSGIGWFPLLTVGWTLNYEMVFYVIFFLGLFFSRGLIFFALIAGVYLLQGWVYKLGGEFVFYGNNIMFEFVFGILICVIYRRGWLAIVNPYVALLMIMSSVFFIGSSSGVTHDPIRFGVPCAILLMAALSQEKYFPESGLIQRLGDWSYSTYLSHVLVICFVFKFSQAFETEFWLCLIVIFLIVMVISFLSYEFLERPIIRAVKRIGLS